jgi:hypothetical protein
MFRLGTVAQSGLIRGGSKEKAFADENVKDISLLAPWHSSC